VTVNPFISAVTAPLSVTSGNLSVNLSAYAPLASPVFTGNPTAPTATFGDNDTSIATTAFVQSALLGGTAVAKNLEVEVRNQSGSTIPAGSIVYISGATGNKPLITLAQANNDANSAQTMGFTATAIANNGTGYVIVRGECQNLDTSALTEGTQLYLSPTVAGAYTTTKPSAPQHLVYVGIVIRSHPTLGTILVAVQNGYELGEIHDVAIGTLANNDLLAYESSTDLWKNKTYSALGLAPLASPSLTGTPLSTTAAADTNTTQIATTAFVVGQASSSTPAATGTAAVGTSLRYARADHVHANPLPTGGTTGQVLSKVDGTNYNTTWTTVSGGTFTGGPITSPITSTTTNSVVTLGVDPVSTVNGLTISPGSGGYAGTSSQIDYYTGFTNVNGSYGSVQVAAGYDGIVMQSGSATMRVKADDCIFNNDGVTFLSYTTSYKNSGITFSDGTTQTTAPTATNPTSSTAIWYGSGWYSANVSSVYDNNTSSYVNVLSF
jgi:hypothetical protein